MLRSVVFIFIGLLIVGVLFGWQTVLLNPKLPIDANRFANYGTFVTSVLSILTVIFLYQTLKLTRKQFRESVYLSSLNNHDAIVSRLDERPETSEGGTFFEVIYRKLHELYHHLNDRKIDRIGQFFYNHYWMIGHYLRNFSQTLRAIDINEELSATEKSYYIGLLQSRLSFDELRLIFYYTVSPSYRGENDQQNEAFEKLELVEKRELRELTRKYNLFDPIKRYSLPLIYQEDWNLLEEQR